MRIFILVVKHFISKNHCIFSEDNTLLYIHYTEVSSVKRMDDLLESSFVGSGVVPPWCCEIAGLSRTCDIGLIHNTSCSTHTSHTSPGVKMNLFPPDLLLQAPKQTEFLFDTCDVLMLEDLKKNYVRTRFVFEELLFKG